MFGGGGGYGDGMGGGFQQDGFGSQAGGGDKSRRGRSQNIAPLTNADVASLKHDGNGFFLGEVEVGQVTILGVVTNVDKSQTSVTYTVDDSTAAPTTIKHWYSMEGGEDDTESPDHVIYNEETYVRVYAHIRSFQNKIALSALKIMPVTDMNELTTHILECLKFKMSLSKKTKPSTMNESMNVGSGIGNSAMPSSVHSSGIDKIQEQVFKVIQACEEESGVGMAYLKKQLQGLNNNQIKNAIEFLSNEGHIYSTIDDDHFKSTG